MKAIYKSGDLLCTVIERIGDAVLLEPVGGDDTTRFVVELEDPRLILDPTDDQALAASRWTCEETAPRT